jgi:hypothetical protein
MEAITASQVLDVRERAGREVVEYPHLVPLVQEELGEVGSDEAGASGNQGLGTHRPGRVPGTPGEPPA